MKYFEITNHNRNNVLLNIPHNSTHIPKPAGKNYLLSKKSLDYETKSMADLYTKELFSGIVKKYDSITMTVSRIFVDIERFAEEEKEPMSKVGM